MNVQNPIVQAWEDAGRPHPFATFRDGYVAAQPAASAEPEWIDDPHDIEQGMMRNPRCCAPVAAQSAATAISNAALEEATRQCEDIYGWRWAYSVDPIHKDTLTACATAIRALKLQPAQASALDREPSLLRPLTPYGLLVRALRIVSGTSLMEMSKATGYTPAYLSGIEFGREPLTEEIVSAAWHFFWGGGLCVSRDLLLQAAHAAKGQA